MIRRRRILLLTAKNATSLTPSLVARPRYMPVVLKLKIACPSGVTRITPPSPPSSATSAMTKSAATCARSPKLARNILAIVRNDPELGKRPQPRANLVRYADANEILAPPGR